MAQRIRCRSVAAGLFLVFIIIFPALHPAAVSAGNSTLTIDNDGITLDEVKAPLEVSTSTGTAITGSSTAVMGSGVAGRALGDNAYAVYGYANGSHGYGLYGYASGSGGCGVYGEAADTGFDDNYGGYFKASGQYGKGVYGEAQGSDGKGVYGEAQGSYGKGVCGYATGEYGHGVWGYTTGGSGCGVYGEAAATGADENYGGYFKASGQYGNGVCGGATGSEGCGVFGYASGNNGTGVCGQGRKYDFYANGPGANYGPFTGAHDVRLAEDAAGPIRPGMIVVCTGRVAVRESENGKPCLSSTLPTVTLAARAADKRVFGVLVDEGPLPKDHWYEAAGGERFGVVNALGEGLVWVCDINGKIGVGDYITTSPVPGYGQLQDDDLVHSYTLGKATADIDWEKVTETIEFNGRRVKIYLLPVVYTSG